MNFEPEYMTACGKTIVLSAKAQEHLKAHLDVQGLLPEAISKVSVSEEGFFEFEVDMGRFVGKAELVKQKPQGQDDTMLFAIRKGRNNPTRVVIIDDEKDLQDSNHITVIAKPHPGRHGKYELLTAWVGKRAKREPCDKTFATVEELSESIEFWCRNALKYDPSIMDEPFESTWTSVLNNNPGQRFRKHPNRPF